MKLKKITKAEFDLIVKNEYGIKEYPGFTDFSDITSFGEWSSFGEGSSFGKGSSFENHKALSPFFIRINNIGSRKDGCTIFNFEDGIFIRSGCFFGSEIDFLQRLKATHDVDSKHFKEYSLSLELAKISFEK